MAETYGWGDTAACIANCASGCLSCGVSVPKMAALVAVGELANYQAP